MTAIHLHYTSDVGTTYKRALTRIFRVRDQVIPGRIALLATRATHDSWSVLNRQKEDDTMRKPRDFDDELKALDARAKVLRMRQRDHLGELVIATGAHALPIEMLAGALLAAVETKDAAAKEAWRTRGAAFFRGKERASSSGTDRRVRGAAAAGDGAQPPAGDAGAS